MGTYNSTTGYTNAELARATQQTGGVTGHGSKPSNKGARQNAATTQSSQVFFQQLRENKAEAKEETKQAHLDARNEKRGDPSVFKIAMTRAVSIHEAKGNEGVGHFAQFLEDKGYAEQLSEAQLNKLYAIFE
ncbi:MAG TPA: hypothetical protein VJV79_33150 [Polyangiaceae bacterium]|nr:hypothetical protein [Polyangiaceae bacterium]